METLRSGDGVMDICGDPGFLAAELLRSGIHVTVVDPGFGQSGKTDPATMRYVNDPAHAHRVRSGVKPFTIIAEMFDEDFVNKRPETMDRISAIVALYPDEPTDYIIRLTADWNKRVAMIPCNECVRFYPPHEPTHEGFVKQLLRNDAQYLETPAGKQGGALPLRRETIFGSPFCNVLLHRGASMGAWGVDRSDFGDFAALAPHSSARTHQEAFVNGSNDGDFERSAKFSRV